LFLVGLAMNRGAFLLMSCVVFMPAHGADGHFLEYPDAI
jgi:hypothetical protein